MATINDKHILLERLDGIADKLNNWAVNTGRCLGFQVALTGDGRYPGIEVTSGSNPLWIATFRWQLDGDVLCVFTENNSAPCLEDVRELGAVAEIIAALD